MPHVDPKRRKQLASRAAHISWSKTPVRRERMSSAWQGRDRKFLDQVDPDGVMDPEEREKAAESARKAHYQEMGRKSGEARAAKKRQRQQQNRAA